jgi:2'-5' RNA ligase
MLSEDTPEPSGAGSPALRTFVALALGPEQIEALRQVQVSLQDHPTAELVRWTRPDQIHLTLRFLGNVVREIIPEVEKRLRLACAGSAPFTLRLGGLGCFPHRRAPRVIWVGLEGALDSLSQLQRAVANALADVGDHREEKAFHPHLTLGRLRNARREELADFGEGLMRHQVPDLGSWTVQEVRLMRSELDASGARHTSLLRVPLQPSRQPGRSPKTP